jgi:acyl-coenzyme A synthetase/AMP-(fatty) acid ligase
MGVNPHDLVSFYLTNSPEFVFAWLGLWAIGAAPAMINYNLAGNALVHCLKVAGSKHILVDDDPELMGRIEGVREAIEETIGSAICILDENTKKEIRGRKAERPGDEYRQGVQGNWPMCIFYTR